MICGKPFPYGPDIASDDHSVRERALAKIIVFVSELTEMSDADGEKLWYVIRNGLWKTDGVMTQHDFCRKISAALFDVPESVTKVFIHTFFTSFGDDWGKVDKWRIEKYHVLVRYFLDKVHEWAKSNKNEDYLITVYQDVLSMQTGTGLQLQFVDVVTPYVTDLVRNGGSDGARFVKPFSFVFAKSHNQPALVRKIYDKLIDPLLESDGESLFGCDVDATLHFVRGLVSLLGKVVKEQETNQQIIQLRFATLKRARAVIAEILKAREAAGEPAAKETE